tara:strand:- start:359 stop:1204 length:846 start_codon:yes stop_codon:yes gene_type:complete
MQKIDLRILEGKDMNSIFTFGLKLKEQNLEGQINAHTIFSTLVEKINEANLIKDKYVIGKLKQEIWSIEKSFGWNSKFHSQAGQDKLIYEKFFHNQTDGFFVDLGAYDGVLGSNTLFFENNLDWQGVLVEPSKNQFSKLNNNRKNKCINKAVGNKNDNLEFIDVVSGYTMMSGLNQSYYDDTFKIVNSDLNSKTEKYNIEVQTFDNLVDTKLIDYLSIDIEGGELRILENIDFDLYKIKVISVENNNPQVISYKDYLNTKGFTFFGYCGNDEIYYNKNNFT